ncbi:hypothetical protein HPB48_001279 [Haemaphysalis longicornis]|uniref:Uncharacterized protein n=1 Tax=Haemaphysalis longicornis TaxID=44386 RepID=A0A9J6FJL2_HAELO|nr:hypothetical protein HPB48_001279 [Haemaphysalis longicornis]
MDPGKIHLGPEKRRSGSRILARAHRQRCRQQGGVYTRAPGAARALSDGICLTTASEVHGAHCGGGANHDVPIVGDGCIPGRLQMARPFFHQPQRRAGCTALAPPLGFPTHVAGRWFAARDALLSLPLLLRVHRHFKNHKDSPAIVADACVNCCIPVPRCRAA